VIVPVRGPGNCPDYQDPGKRPCKATMQPAFARHVAQGGYFRGGGCFLLAEDLDWDSQRCRYTNYFTKNS